METLFAFLLVLFFGLTKFLGKYYCNTFSKSSHYGDENIQSISHHRFLMYSNPCMFLLADMATCNWLVDVELLPSRQLPSPPRTWRPSWKKDRKHPRKQRAYCLTQLTTNVSTHLCWRPFMWACQLLVHPYTTLT